MSEKIDEIADAIEQSMKKGHISTLILLALEKGPSHGYNLMQVITDGTYGEWNPTASSLYPHLASLTEKGLIKYNTEADGKRERKVYEITEKGKETLKEIIERQQSMRRSFLSMIFSTMGITDETIPNEFEEFLGPDIIDDTSLIDKNNEEKLEILEKRKLVLSKVISKLQNFIDEIDSKIQNLKRPKL